MDTKIIAVALALVLVFGLFIDVVSPTYGFFTRVPTSHVGIVTTFGKMSDETLEPGFHFKNFFDKVSSVDTRTQKYTLPVLAFSSDIQQVELTATLNFNVDKKNAPTLFREIGSNYTSSLIDARFQEDVKIVIARYNAEALILNRENLSNEVKELLMEDLAPYGVNVTGVSITDIDFTDAFTNAVEAKQVATQERLTAQTKEEQKTMEAQAEAQRKTIAAQAEAEIARIEAEAEAYAIKMKAEAEAEANKAVADSITEELIDYNKIQQWNGEMPQFMSNGGESIIPMIDMTE